MEAMEYWNEIGCTKEFEDPLYIEKIKSHVPKDAAIVEYGCGYGRMMDILKREGYNNLRGFDFSKRMIEKGKSAFPDLDMKFLEINGVIPLEDESVDFVVLSTVLCCMVDIDQQVDLIEEIKRVLKPDGYIYITDFMINDNELYQEKYEEGLKAFGEWGVYTTNEGLTVRHHSTNWIMDLFSSLNVLWFEQFDFKTMNNNPAKTFHAIVQKNANLDSGEY